jgi:hypothetical protein
MPINDMFLNNMFFASIIKLENQYLCIIYFLGYWIFSNITFNKLYNYIINIYTFENKITFISSDKDSSERFRALMYYIIENNKVIQIKEVERYKTTWDSDKIAYYKVNQKHRFLIKENIYGLILFKEKELKQNSITSYEEYQQLEIYSPVLNIKELKYFVEQCNKDYDFYLKSNLLKHQLFVDISWDTVEKDIKVKYNNWSSSTTFNNKFFTDKELVLNKVSFFLEEKEIYKKRGIPHTLGFLLYGEPGTGKSSFIKAVANKTNYHIINIKLSKNFDLESLHDILYNETITTDLKIPLNKRLIIFEDIDCMYDIIKSREIKSTNILYTATEESNKIIDFIQKNKIDENENNNLSCLLNILDGVQEAEDRIIIMTTNKPEELDKALTRPGRIDMKIHFTKATLKDIKDILSNFWGTDTNFDLNSILNYKFTHATIINICKEALNLEDTIEKLNLFIV